MVQYELEHWEHDLIVTCLCKQCNLDRVHKYWEDTRHERNQQNHP